jgi:hypothetical protein
MKAHFAAVLFTLTTGCVASGGYSGGVAVATPQPVVTATVSTDPGPPVEEAPPVDDANYDDDVYEGEPDLVEYEGNSNIRIVYGASDPVFYSDGYYWRYGDDGTWFRSSVHTGGWSVYADVPVHVRTIDRPIRFRSYRPATYTPRVRKAGVRPANSRPSYTRTNRQPARNYGNNRPDARRPAATPNKPDNRNYGNNRPDARQPTKATPAQPDRSYGNNRPDARQPSPVKATPTQPAYKQPSPVKAEPAKPAYKQPDPPKKAEPARPAPKKDPPKKDDDYKKKDKRR